MADGLNKVMLLGNLGADPELRMTSSGQAVLKLRVATSETYLDKNRNRQEKTEWHSVVIWGKRAEVVATNIILSGRAGGGGGGSRDNYDGPGGGYEPAGGGYDGPPQGGDARSDSFGPGPDDDDIPF
jgi:single-strand DNA-binding protein